MAEGLEDISDDLRSLNQKLDALQSLVVASGFISDSDTESNYEVSVSAQSNLISLI